jgi:hypothetical protein
MIFAVQRVFENGIRSGGAAAAGLRVWRLLFLALALLAGARAGAEQEPVSPGFRLPLQCTPGRDCWIAIHVDLDPGPGTMDYACGHLTYDGHKGTDFALRDLKAMADGVAVVAAAAGEVLRTRDGEPDVNVRVRGRATVKGRECGNAVVIAHAGGFETQYCHLRRGSVSVGRGTRVAAGDPIGLVGLSGDTEFPHVHVTMRHRGRVVDPFRGIPDSGRCGRGATPLWEPETAALLPYAPGALYNFGVAGEAAKAEAVREGAYRRLVLPADAPVFAVWAEAFGIVAGDAFEVAVDAPDGKPFIRHRGAIAKNQARIYRIVGRKRGASDWPAGAYQARMRIVPACGEPARSAVEFSVEVR